MQTLQQWFCAIFSRFLVHSMGWLHHSHAGALAPDLVCFCTWCRTWSSPSVSANHRLVNPCLIMDSNLSSVQHQVPQNS